MSLNKVIIVFIVILIAFGGFIFFQFSKASVPTSKVVIGKQTFFVSVAKTAEEMEKGLSGRNSLPQDQGMLFDFQQSGNHAFWMKGMKFPLDIIFINNKKIVSIAKNAPVVKNPAAGLPLYTSSQPADQVLEINAGLSDKYGFKIGDQVNVTEEASKSANSAKDK